MQILSFKKCQTCLVKMCCQNVCEDYKEYIFKTRGIQVVAKSIELQKCEGAVAMCIERSEDLQFSGWSYKVTPEITRGIE